MRTLVLNAGFEPVQLISWQRAICLVFQAKAEIVSQYETVVRTVSQSFQMPSVVRLLRYVRVASKLGVVRCTRRNVLLRDRYQCQYCGVRCRVQAITIDHVLPRSKGGKTSWTNVVAACHTCNRRKANRTPERAGMKLMREPRRPGWRDLIEDPTSSLDRGWLPWLGISRKDDEEDNEVPPVDDTGS